MKNKKRFLITLLLVGVTLNLIAGIDALVNMNPLVPFSLTYEYRTPREWQVEVLVGTSLDIASVSRQSTGSTFYTGQAGLKFGLPGDIVLLASWPWVGGYICIDEQTFLPEFDVSINVPMTFGTAIGNSGPAINLNTIFKKSLQPVRFSVGHNLLFSNTYEYKPDEATTTTVGEQYVGTGLEWQVNPYFRLFGEFRYQISEILYYNDGEDVEFNYDFLIAPGRANNILSLGGEYILNTEHFAMKTTAGYAINLKPYQINNAGTPFTSHSVSVGISFLFPFPLAPEYWENEYSPLGAVP